MNLKWRQEGEALLADSDYGVYSIRVKTPGVIALALTNRHGEVLLTGEHSTIGGASDSAAEDLRFRQRMWETL